MTTNLPKLQVDRSGGNSSRSDSRQKFSQVEVEAFIEYDTAPYFYSHIELPEPFANQIDNEFPFDRYCPLRRECDSRFLNLLFQKSPATNSGPALHPGVFSACAWLFDRRPVHPDLQVLSIGWIDLAELKDLLNANRIEVDTLNLPTRLLITTMETIGSRFGESRVRLVLRILQPKI